MGLNKYLHGNNFRDSNIGKKVFLFADSMITHDENPRDYVKQTLQLMGEFNRKQSQIDY